MTQKQHKQKILETNWEAFHAFYMEVFGEFDYIIYKRDRFNYNIRGPDRYSSLIESCSCCKIPIKCGPLERFDDNELLVCKSCYTMYEKYLIKYG